MKIFEFLLFFAMFVVVEINSLNSEELEEEIMKWKDECAAELDIPEEKMIEYESMTEPPVERMATCLTACIFRKAGFIKDGALQDVLLELIIEEIEAEKDEIKEIKKMYKKCVKKASMEADECDITGVFIKCLYDEIQSLEIPDA